MLRDLLAIGSERSGRRRTAGWRKRIRAGGLRNFACTACGQRIYFENSLCLRCENKLGFLPDDLDEPWAAVTRQRCQRQLEHAVRVVAQGHEDRGDWVEALECYTRALSRDETAESFHRGRMRCLAHLGREADALAAYAQLRRLLAVRLGAAPSSETAELAEHIRSSRPAAPSAASPGD